MTECYNVNSRENPLVGFFKQIKTGKWWLDSSRKCELKRHDWVLRPDGVLLRWNGAKLINVDRAKKYYETHRFKQLNYQRFQYKTNPYFRKKILDYERNRYNRPEIREKKLTKLREYYKKPGVCVRILKRLKHLRDTNPEWRKRVNEYRRRRYYMHRGTKPGDLRLKQHENNVIEFLQQKYSEAELLLGQSVGNVCTETRTHRYPDVLLHFCSFPICVEIDENGHRGASYSCDWRRMNEICISLGSPVWFIRYNPNNNAKLDALRETIEKIRTATNVLWEYNRQFNVSFIGFSEKQLEIQEARKKIAGLANTDCLSGSTSNGIMTLYDTACISTHSCHH